jgi:2-methylisocitrate lyase-like PEP mutase family enzyme
LAAKGGVIAPCAFDALSAKAIEWAGFELIGTTGYGMHAASLGEPDMGQLTMTEVADVCARICSCVSLPVMADAEGGYGNAFNTIRTVKEFERAGLAGIFIEDQQLPTVCPFIRTPVLISIEEMVGKIKAALDVKEDPDFVIVARTDATGREAIERAQAYIEAGADMIKPVVKTKEELWDLPKSIHVPMHLGMIPGLEMNRGLQIQELFDAGYKIITFPVSPLFGATWGMMKVLKEIKTKGSDDGVLDAMIPMSDFPDFIGVQKYKDWATKYLSFQNPEGVKS